MATAVPALVLSNLKTHLETKISTWSISRVDAYPSYRSPGQAGPCISLEIEDWRTRFVEVSHPTRVFDWITIVRLSYYDLNFVPENAYTEVVDKLGLITAFLLTSNRPNSYGNVLIDGASFGPELGFLPNAPDQGSVFGGQIIITHTRTETITAP